jgi:hypothetical protein
VREFLKTIERVFSAGCQIAPERDSGLGTLLLVCDTLGPVPHARTRLKWICCMVWILGCLLVLAAIDKVPDPPAANPNSTQFSDSCLHERSLAPVSPFAFMGIPSHFPLVFVAAEAVEFFPYNDLSNSIERAADPSPPVRQLT